MSTTQIETISNKLIFNLLTNRGFQSLTDFGNNGEVVDSDDNQNPSEGINPSFSLGRIVITAGARAILTDDDVDNALFRHTTGDWGTVSKEDWASNNKALKNGERIISSYLSSDDVKFWVITEWDRSATTVLLPEEY